MTFLLDTNVVSELRKRDAAPAVVAWADSRRPGELFLSAITIREIEAGILAKEHQDPAQGSVLRRWFEQKVLGGYAGRVLAVDLDVARRAATLHVPNPLPERDGLIAATALTHGLIMVTRNVQDFEATGVPIINPWAGLPPDER